MDQKPGDRSRSSARLHQLPYPRHKIVAAVARSDTDGIVAALNAAGFAPDRVEIISADDVSGLGEPIGGSGLHGLLTRLQLSLGDDLDELEEARRELIHGHVLILVLVHGNGEQDRVHAILSEHGGHAMRYFGPWTITTLEGPAR